MGILDKKTRFIDLVVTQEGKRQIAAGKLRAEFASISDCNAFYDKSEPDNAQDRLYFEVMERPENAIVLEKDDSGLLFPFDFSPTGSIVGNNIFLGEVEQNVVRMKATTGSQFSSTQAEILDKSLQHFKKNYFIGTEDISDRNEFEIDNKEIVFTMTNRQPFLGTPYRQVINVNDAEPFFLDSKLAHIPNFQFLPPKNVDGTPFGTYEDLRSTSKSTWNDIKSSLGIEYDSIDTFIGDGEINLKDINIVQVADAIRSALESYESKVNPQFSPQFLSKYLLKNGQLPDILTKAKKQVETIRFPKTSTENNFILQVYENSTGAMLTKLEIIDAGVFTDENDPNDRIRKRVFYIGKVFFDDFNTPTFINMFTLIMD